MFCSRTLRYYSKLCINKSVRTLHNYCGFGERWNRDFIFLQMLVSSYFFRIYIYAITFNVNLHIEVFIKCSALHPSSHWLLHKNITTCSSRIFRRKVEVDLFTRSVVVTDLVYEECCYFPPLVVESLGKVFTSYIEVFTSYII